jgi:MoaA/NifB/PqqE/SkfB family radical SAM enzyme
MVPAFTSLVRPALNVIQDRPILAVFEVTLRCNSACGYCDLPLNQGRYEMTREEIRRVCADLYREGVRFLFVQGGEPLLRRDLPEILEDLHELGFGLTLITNGTRLTPPLVRRLAALPLNLSVSLDTLDRERYRRIRGADQLADVVEGIGLLQDFPHPKYLTIIASEVNRDEVETMVRFARGRGFLPVVGAYHWGIERYGKAEAGLQYDRRMLAGVFERVLESGLVPRGYFRDYLRDNVRWLSGGALDRCDAGRYSIAIDASGNVAPCLAQAFAGNLLRQPLSEILARFDRDAIRRCSDRSSCNLLCSRVVGSILRHPATAAMTPLRLKKVEV